MSPDLNAPDFPAFPKQRITRVRGVYASETFLTRIR
jgi:hypothetical protein